MHTIICMCIHMHAHPYIFKCIRMYTYEYISICSIHMGWLRVVGSLKLQVSFAEYSLFYRALLQKRPVVLRSLLIVATPYLYISYAFTHITHIHKYYTRLDIYLYELMTRAHVHDRCI